MKSALEQAEQNIIYEADDFWVQRRRSTDASIAPLGSIYYQTFHVDGVASYSDGLSGLPFVTADRDRAVKHCDRMAEKWSRE